jgi:branched-chain amino acid transport system permease protein
LLAAVGLAGAVGALIALPALRLRGLYLALATLAFAYAMDVAFFTSPRFFGTSDALNVARVHIPGINMSSDRTYLIFEAVVFAIIAIGVLALRRAPFGRRLVALSDSPGASVSVGVRTTRAKLAVFTIASAIAGLGGALYGGAQGTVGPNDFAFLLSLTVLMLAVVWGIRSVTGMLVAGVAFALGPLLQSHVSSPREIVQLLVGLAAIGIAQNPAGILGSGGPRMNRRRGHSGQRPTADTTDSTPQESLSNAAS